MALEPTHLTPRDAPGSNITNLVAALDFAHPDRRVPPLPLLITPVLDACAPVLPQVDDPWQRLLRSPLLAGWDRRCDGYALSWPSTSGSRWATPRTSIGKRT